MTFYSEKDRESYINFLSVEISSDLDNIEEMMPFIGMMKNKTSEKQLDATIKRFKKSVETNNKLIAQALDAELSEISKPAFHLRKYGYNYEVFKEQ